MWIWNHESSDMQYIGQAIFIFYYSYYYYYFLCSFESRYLREYNTIEGEKKRKKENYRCEQGSNLRGKIPLDFKSNALTTRPSQHLIDSRRNLIN